ncbi:MAG: hypothetical protein WA947_16295 [Phormidesmis sp.]
MKSMGLNTRFTVGSVILAIMLLSIFGVSRAFRSLSGNDPEARTESSRVDSFTDSNEPGSSSRTGSQNNAQPADVRTLDDEGELVFTPLQTAGTFIQRQQRIEEDQTVSATEVSVVAVADNVADTPPASQGNTITNDQSATSDTSTSTSSESTSTSPAATSPAVPALW